ncbi:MAG: hypothetical protein ACKO38_11835 [Planctomycetota bacterium]
MTDGRACESGLGLFQLGTLPADLSRKSIKLFGSNVMSAFPAIVPATSESASSELALRASLSV